MQRTFIDGPGRFVATFTQHGINVPAAVQKYLDAGLSEVAGVPPDPMHEHRWDGVTWQKDAPLSEDERGNFKVEVNAAAEDARLKYITPGDGQAMSYREKLDEAKSCLAAYATEADFTAASPPAGTYPLLESEVGIKGANAWKVAELVNATFTAWKLVEAQINGLRLQASTDLDGATTVGEAKTIVDGIAWPAPA